MTDVELVVARDAEQAAREAAELLARAARAGAGIVLTGGTTPRRAYELAADLERDWSAVTLWWSDERCVPPEDERSNYGLAKKSLLDRLEQAPRAVHRIRGELGAESAANEYDAKLATAALDVALLGLGPDGHAASLYPNAPTLDATARAVSAEAQLAPLVDRVTMTIPLLSSAKEVVFIVTGADKAPAARAAFTGPPDRAVPGSLIRSTNGRTRAILDQEAASAIAL